jgi:hypothetical protein
MSKENVEIVRAMFEQFAQGDFSGLADVAEDFEWISETVDNGVGGVLWEVHGRGHGDHRCGRQGFRRNRPTGPHWRKPNRGRGLLVDRADGSRRRGYAGRGICGTRSGPRSFWAAGVGDVTRRSSPRQRLRVVPFNPAPIAQLDRATPS